MDVSRISADDIARLWLRGEAAGNARAMSDTQSMALRKRLIRTLLDGPAEQAATRRSDLLRRLLALIARRHGGTLNESQLASELAIRRPALQGCIQQLAAARLLRLLEPLPTGVGVSARQAPRVYIRDSGMLHCLLDIANAVQLARHPLLGASWEGFAIESLLSVTPDGARAGYYRSDFDAEMDLVLQFPWRCRWAFEIKLQVGTRLRRPFHNAMAALRPDRAFLVHSGPERFSVMPGVEAIGLREISQVIKENNREQMEP